MEHSWIADNRTIGERKVPIITHKLKLSDILRGWNVRWGINRMNYGITPGLYGIGNPGPGSPVLVTANYKLTFDKLRTELSDVNAWILVLDTKGINVWCAAGKGTFGTDELIKRVKEAGLNGIVDHKRLILPQLGAVGVSAHKVKAATGFEVIYGPVRACDIKYFLNNKLTKTAEMRQVNFNMADRASVIGIELISAFKALLIISAVVTALHFAFGQFALNKILYYIIPFTAAVFTGAVIFPLLLPWLPFRAFALKGALLGAALTVLVALALNTTALGSITFFLLLTPLISFIAMNYTGASTFTSQTGAALEVRIGTPVMIGTFASGILFEILSKLNVF